VGHRLIFSRTHRPNRHSEMVWRGSGETVITTLQCNDFDWNDKGWHSPKTSWVVPGFSTFHPWYIHPWYSVVIVLFTIIGPCGVKMIDVSYILHACANEEKKHSKPSHSSYCVVASLWRLRVVKKQWGWGKCCCFVDKAIMRKSHETWRWLCIGLGPRPKHPCTQITS